jgi:hypothetical protein
MPMRLPPVALLYWHLIVSYLIAYVSQYFDCVWFEFFLAPRPFLRAFPLLIALTCLLHQIVPSQGSTLKDNTFSSVKTVSG